MCFLPYELVFLTQPCLPLKVPLNLSRTNYREFTAQHCSLLPLHSRYQITDINPLFRIILLKPFFTSFLATVTAMLQF